MAETNPQKESRQKGTPREVQPNEQLSDILLVMDKVKLAVRAISKIDKEGNVQTVPADESHQNSFLKFDKHSSILENFLKNFWSQLKDPTRFRVFKMTSGEFKQNQEAITDLANGKESDKVKEFLKKYEFRPCEIKQPSINNKNEKVMAKQENQAGEKTKYRYNEAMINWDQLKDLGLSKDYLQARGLLEPLLRGYKTNEAVPISMNFGMAILRTDAKLSLQTTREGTLAVAIHGIRKEPDLNYPYFGHNFSDEDKRNLRESGNMGRVVDLNFRGENTPSFISIDRVTNEIVSLRADYLYMPNEVSGVKLTDAEKNDLREGRAIFVEGMTSKAGREFDAYLQVNAERRGIEYIFPQDLGIVHELGGVKLSEKQQDDLKEGKAILVEGMKSKNNDQLYDRYVKLDPGTKRAVFTRHNPDSPEGAREIIVPQEMNGSPLTPEDRTELRKGNAVFIEDMVRQDGSEYSCFVKLDLETGIPKYANSMDGFDQEVTYQIPQDIMGVKLDAATRAKLQDGETIFVDGIKGHDGSTMSTYAKVNPNTGILNYYSENPDIRRDNAQAQGSEKKQDAKQSAKKDSTKSKSKKKSGPKL